MIATKPAVQNIRRVKRYVCLGSNHLRFAKRNANRRHRRALNRITRRFIQDPERFYDEGFNAPSLSTWDLD